MEIMSTKGRKDCELCLNHGLRIDFTADHQIKCQFIDCKCDKCSHFVVINEDNQIVLRKLNSIVKTANNTIINNNFNDIHKNKSFKIDDKSSQTDFPPRDPLEAVKSFADHLSKIDISENNLRTCVMYALLKNNGFSVEDTKRKLFEARTAITESLVLPLKRTNSLNSNQKRSFSSFLNQDSFSPKKKLCLESKPSTARKTFSKSSIKSVKNSNLTIITKRPEVNVSSNSQYFIKAANTSVQTCEQTLLKPVLKSPTSVASNKMISPKNIAPKPVSVSTQPKFISNQCISMIKTPNDSKKPETIVQQNNKTIPIGTQTISNCNINPNIATTYILPIYPIMNLQSGTSPTFFQLPYGVSPTQIEVTKSSPQVISIPKTSYTSATIGSIGALRGFDPIPKTVANNIIRVSPSTNNYSTSKTVNDCALKGIRINSITKVPTNSIATNSITNIPTVRKPDLKTYSRISPNNRSNQNASNDNLINNNKLCAKIITSEAALAALSTISNNHFTNQSQNNMSDNCQTQENNTNKEEIEEYILPDENSISADELSNNAVNTYVINTLDKPMAANLTQNKELSNNQIPLIISMTESPVSQNMPQKSVQAPKSLRLQKLTNKKFIESQNYISKVMSGMKSKETANSPNIKFVQQNNLNKNKNIIHITIDD